MGVKLCNPFFHRPSLLTDSHLATLYHRVTQIPLTRPSLVVSIITSQHRVTALLFLVLLVWTVTGQYYTTLVPWSVFPAPRLATPCPPSLASPVILPSDLQAVFPCIPQRFHEIKGKVKIVVTSSILIFGNKSFRGVSSHGFSFIHIPAL